MLIEFFPFWVCLCKIEGFIKINPLNVVFIQTNPSNEGFIKINPSTEGFIQINS